MNARILESKDHPATHTNTWRKALRDWSQKYLIDAFTGMAFGLFVTLVAGLIISQFGNWLNLTALVGIGKFASMLMGAGIGAGITHHLKAPPVVVLGAVVAGMMGAHADVFILGMSASDDALMFAVRPGNPIAAYLTTVFAYAVAVRVIGKTKLDILSVPLVMMLVSWGVCAWLCPPVVWVVDAIGQGIIHATELNPWLMGIVVSVIVGLLLTLPTSSAAICIAIGLGGLAGGAAVVGGAAHMIGFAVTSYRDNGISGLVAQGLGTSMLQIPNVFRKPIILVPPVVASAVTGFLAAAVFGLHCTATGSGMGTSGLVGVFAILDANPDMPHLKLWLAIVLLMFVLPAVVSWVVATWMRHCGMIQDGDMKIHG